MQENPQSYNWNNTQRGQKVVLESYYAIFQMYVFHKGLLWIYVE